MDINDIRKKVCSTCWKTQCICQNLSHHAAASILTERLRFEIGLREAGWSGLRLAALCIGVGAYSGSSRLDNPVQDAQALFEAINKFPDCRAAILRDPQDKSTMTITYVMSFWRS